MPNADEFDRLVASYFEQVDAGVEIDPHVFMTDNPEHAEGLQGLFKNLGVLDNLFGAVQRQEKPRAAATDKIGDFRIIRELGRGGMGIVYEAEEINVGRTVALKVLYASAALDLARLTRFQNESRASASLSHNHIVPVYSVGMVEGTHYFAMKLIDGPSLAEIIKSTSTETADSHSLAKHIGIISTPSTIAEETHLQNRSTITARSSKAVVRDRSLDFTRICNLVSDVALALEHAHERGIVHRDIKPSNLLVDSDGMVWVTDFGLAHIDQEATITATGEILGTLQYMSPEQAIGQAPDRRSDIYSLGVVLYQLLTGELPFRGKRNAILTQVITEDPAQPRSLNASIPRDLETICLMCLQKKPHQRYQSSQKFADDLQRYVDRVPIKARPVSAIERAYKWCVRHQAITMASLLGLFSIALIVGVIARDARIQASVNRTLQHSLESSERSRKDAEAARKTAQKRAAELRLQNYSRDMTLAYQAYNKGWSEEVERLLRAQVPKARGDTSILEKDLRGFEWQLLRKLNHRAPPIVLGGQDGPINDVAVFDSGKRIASVGDDSVIRIWNIEKREQEFELRDDRLGANRQDLWSSLSTTETGFVAGNEYLAVAVSPEGKNLFAGNLALTMWDLEKRTRVKDLMFFDTRIDSVALSPDGKRVAAHSRNEFLKVAELDDVDNQQTIRTDFGLFRIEFSNDGKQIAAPYKTSSTLLGLSCWDAKTLKPIEDYSGSAIYRCPTFSSDDRFMFVGTFSDDIVLIDRTLGEVVARSPKQRSGISDMALSADDKVLAVSHLDGSLVYWHLPPKWYLFPENTFAGKFTTIVAHKGPSEAVRFVDKDRVVTCGDDGLLKIWSALGQRKSQSIGRTGELVGVPLLLDGNGFWGGSRNSVHYFELSRNCLERTISLLDPVADPNEAIRTVAQCPSSHRIASATYNGQIVVVDKKDGQEVYRTRQDDLRPSPINHLAFSPDGKWLANVSGDHTVRVRATEDWQEVERFITVGWGSSVAFSSDGRRLAFTDLSGCIALVEVGTWTELCRIETNSGIPAACIEFTHDGKQLITGHLDSVIRIWNAHTLKAMGRMKGHNQRMLGIRLHPDGRTLASTSVDKTLRLWHLPTLSEIGTIETFEFPANHLLFDRNGTKLIATAGSQTPDKAGYRIWDLGQPLP